MTVMKRRKLGIQGIDGQSSAERLKTALEELKGVYSVSVGEGGTLQIVYDMVQIKFADLERELKRLGHPAAASRGQRLRRWWWRYTETNEWDNLTSPADVWNSYPHDILDDKR